MKPVVQFTKIYLNNENNGYFISLKGIKLYTF